MNKVLSTAVFAAGITISSAAFAATADNTMAVSATVVRTCTVSAEALGFPDITTADAGVTATSAVAVSCSAGSADDAPTITLSGGSNLNATSGLRQMIGGDSLTALVPYKLSAASGGLNLAPTDTVGTSTPDNGLTYATTVYGSIDASAAYQKGTFNDTVTVTVTYAP